MHARIQDGIVVELLEDVFNEGGDLVPLVDRFTADIVATCVELPVGEEIAPGWTYSNGTFSPATLPTPEVPSSVTMRQARLALLAAGKLNAVTDVIASLQSPQRELAQIEWEYAATVNRGSQLVALLASAIELDEAALDQLFTAASVL